MSSVSSTTKLETNKTTQTIVKVLCKVLLWETQLIHNSETTIQTIIDKRNKILLLLLLLLFYSVILSITVKTLFEIIHLK